MFQLPNPTSLLADIATWSDPFFTSLLPYALVIVGLISGGILVVFLWNVVLDGLDRLFNGPYDPWDDTRQIRIRNRDLVRNLRADYKDKSGRIHFN